MLGDGTEPVADSEFIYRRIPVSTGWYSDAGLSPRAFDPRKDEETGISFSRAKYTKLEDAAKGRPGKAYFVAEYIAADIRKAGVELVPWPEPGNPGHCQAPALTCHTRESDEALEMMARLASAPRTMHGPFPPPEPSS